MPSLLLAVVVGLLVLVVELELLQPSFSTMMHLMTMKGLERQSAIIRFAAVAVVLAPSQLA